MNNISILYLEDDQIDQMAFIRLVRDENLPYCFKIAGSLADAEKHLSSKTFDIIVCDYNLGDGTALDLLEEIRDTPIIVATGEGTEEIAVKALKMGAYDYLIKDLERNYLKVLPHTVEKVLRLKAVEIEKERYTYELMESRNILESLFKGNPEPSVFLNENFEIIDINPQFERTFGYKLEEIKGSKINKLIVPPQYLNEAREFDKNLEQGPVYYESERTTSKGILINVSISAAPVMVDGKKQGSFVIYKDISRRKQAEKESERLIIELKEALEEVKKLSGLIPICSHCKKIRDDTGYWRQVEEYIREHSDADFSHSICPECLKEVYPRVYSKISKTTAK